MKKQRMICFVLTPLIFLAVSFGTINEAAAEEGGQVQTNAGIVFKESDSSTAQTNESTHNDSSSNKLPNTGKKPTGRLPNTGDLIKVSMLFTGGALILIALIVFFWKKRKRVKRECE
ncbi:LPXTG cell wall anchor domain-containing protein [Enterococcus plantarum]|uniref:LPXTG cell wall anchor domain-containing protein n=1 Tax=Enterococcus plantarum TaxID=1077675 RepID=UPI001A901BF4|nr:LPXTG cell wall anchor domain-containing protein [Enterococcus plantarum]MBO0468085.1 LPXTG cell wall anchor domain-containing protein [Enterococcus plantarum]